MQNESKQVRSWGEVAGSDQFLTLSPEHQERARELYYQDNVAPRVPKGMEQRAREMFDQDTLPDSPSALGLSVPESAAAPGNQGGFITDTGNLLASGVNRAAQNARELVGRIPVVGESIVSAGDAVDKFIQGKDSETLMRENEKKYQGNLTQETQDAQAKLWWDSEKGSLGPAWTDPRAYASGIIQSLPEMALTMGPSGRLAKAAYTRSLAKTGSKAMAAKAAAKTATIAGGIGEGLLGGADTAREVRDKINEMPIDKLMESEAFQSLIEDGLEPEAARKSLAEDAATQGMLIAGVATGAFGGLGDRVFAKMLTGSIKGGVTSRIAKGAIGEGILEELPQSASQKLAENYAMQSADESQELSDGVLNESLGGLATGSVMGGGIGSVASPRADQSPSSTPIDALESQEDATFDGTPDPQALSAPGLQGLLPAPEQTFYADSQGNVQDTGPVKNVDGVMQPSAQGSQWVNPANRADVMGGGPGMDQQTPLGEPAPLTGQFQQGPSQQVEKALPRPGLMLEGEFERAALPAPEAIVVDSQGNAQRGATAPQVFDGTQSGGRGMDQQAPTATRRNNDYDYLTRANGEPFQTATSVKASKIFRDAKKAGRNPEAHQVDGGYAIRMRKDPKRSQMRPESSKELYENKGQPEAATPEPAKAAQPAKQKSPEQQAEYSWGTMNTFERNKAVVDSLGYDAGQADSIASLAWSELNATDKKTLSDGMTNTPAQRWDAPNQKISDRDRPVLQNRDRSTDSSIAQMQGIKTNPDYNRLSVSRDFGNGAPVIEPGAEFPDTQLGRKEKTSTSTGRSIEVQYAAVEADQLLSSNDALGNSVPEYKSGVAGKSRAIAGNGRVAGISAAWKSGKAEGYKQQMIEDTGHGIDPETIKGMKQPVLVRVMPLEEVSSNIGDESNVSGQAGLSAIEQASTDMRRLDLTSLELTADNELSEATVMGFIKGMPTSELGTLLTKSGRPTQAAYNRAETALFQQAYQSEALTENLVDLKGDAKFIMNALMRAAPAMAKLDGAGMYDIRPLVSEAAAIAVNARRTGTPLREYIKTDQIDNNPMVAPILEMMVESGNKTTAIGDKLISLAQTAYAEANKSGQDMFGEVQKLSPGELMRTAFNGEQINDQQDTGSPESLGDEGRAKPDDKPIERQPNVRAGQPDSGAVQEKEQGNEKRAAKPGQAEALTDKKPASKEAAPEKWRANYLLAAKLARSMGIDPKQHGKLPGLTKAIDAANANPETPTLELNQQTEESRAEAERTEKARLEEEKKVEAKQARADAKAKESVNDKQAVESSMDRFELGQSAEQQLSGQVDIFSTESIKAETGIAATTNSDQVTVTDDQYNPNPSEAQKEAGNYKKAHVKFQGLDITIENPVGSERSGKDDKGSAWSNTMKHDYGYIKRTLGADGDHVDVFIGKNHDSDKVFVIDQPKADGTLDEHKVMLGFKGRVQAVAAYKANYAKGWKVGPITEMSVTEFKQWLQNGDTTQPAKESAETKEAVQKKTAKLDTGDLAFGTVSIDTYNNWGKAAGVESASGWKLFTNDGEPVLMRKHKEKNEAGGGYVSIEDVRGFANQEAAKQWAKENPASKRGAPAGSDARYSKTNKGEPQNLYVAHNLSADNLRYASKLGGLAAPSIAIGNIDTGAFSSFGEITLLAEPSMLESSKVRTFDADIYTPRHPQAVYEIDHKAYKTLADKAKKLPGELRFPSTSEIAENGAKAFIYSEGAKMLYLEEQGNAPKAKPRKADAWIKKAAKMGLRKFQLAADPAFKKIAQAEVNRIYSALEEADPVVAERRARFYFDEGTKTISTGRLESMAGEVQTYAESSGVDEAQLRKDISAKLRTKKAEADFSAWAEQQLKSVSTDKKIFAGLTSAGNRKYIDYNLANIVKQMTRELQGGEGFNYGAGSVRSAYANEMKTVESVKNRRDQIVSAEEFSKLKDESNKKLTDALEQLKPYYRYGAEDFGYTSDASSAIAEGPAGIREAFDLDDKGRKIIADLVGYLRNMPTEYFEAKAGRAVDLSEFSYAVVPKGTPGDVLAILRENGIKVKRYDADNPASREEAIRSTNDILFLKDSKEKSDNQKSTNDVKAEAIAKAIADSPELAGVKVVQSFDDLPKSVRDRAKRDGVEPSDLRGIYSGGSTYVVADNHANVAEAVYTAVHEEVGHRGIRDMLGGKLIPTMERIYSSYAATAKGRKLIKDIREDYASVLEGMDAAKQRQVIAEELVAYAVQDGKRPTVIQRYISKVRELLRALFPQVSWTNTDILALGEQSRKWLRSAQDGTASGDAMYSARNSKGSQTKTAAFKKWFGDSEVLTESGDPLVVYRGMDADATVMTPNDKGIIWVTPDKQYASDPHYGGKGGGAVYPLYAKAEKLFDYDNKAHRDALLAEGRSPLFRQAATGNFRAIADEQVTAALKSLGFDGFKAVEPEGQQSIGLFDSVQVKSAIGNTGDFDGANPDIRYSVRRENQQDANDVELPEETRYRKAQRLIQDKLNRFTVIREWLEERGVNLDEDANVYLAEERMHSKFSNKATDFREKTVKPLVEKIQKAGYSMDDVAQYLHAQHAQERNAQIAKINKQMPDGGSGMTNAEAREILAAADKNLVNLSKEMRAITDNTRKVLLESGLISKEQAEAWQKAYQHYVPLKGGPDDKASKTGTGSGLKASHKTKRALGHQVREEGEWIIENILADHERALLTAEKNEVGKHLLKMALDVGIDSIMTVSKPEKRAVLHNQISYEVLYKGRPMGSFTSLEGARAFKAAAPSSIGKSVSQTDITIRKTSDPSVVYTASPMPAPNEAMVYVDGDVVRVQINDDLLAQAYGNMGADALGTLLRSAQALNRWFSNVYTGYSPEFLITNVARDFTAGLANITGEEGASFATKTVKNYFTSFGALLRYARKGTEDKWISMYREDGGNTGAAYLSDLERMGADMQTEYAVFQGVTANLRKGETKLAVRAAMRKAFNATLRHLEALNEAGENSMRLALYRTAVEQGMTRNKAASMAKNTTVNFNRKGEMGTQANALYLFFNATVQGSAAVAHANLKGKHKKQAWAVSGAMAALGYTLAMLSAGVDEDDYERTPEHTKDRNLVIPLGNGEALTIPVPYGYGFFFTFGRLMADAQRTGNTDDTAWKLASAFTGEFMPFGGVMEGDEPDMLQAGIFMLPTVAQVPMTVATNRTSFGGPMRPDNPFKQYEPDRLKMWRGTEGTWADALAGALENVGADVSPETLKYMSRTFTGGAGNFVGSTVDAVMLGSQGATPEVREIPIVRKFYRANSVSDARARFWRYQGETRKAVEGFQRAIDSEDRDQIRSFAKENRKLIALGDVAKAFSEAASASRDRVQQIRLGDLPIAQKRDQIKKIEDREAELYDRFVRVFKEKSK